ncbi:MAG: thiamine pyrophosphate-binding protein [Elusimicrobiota bacterium]
MKVRVADYITQKLYEAGAGYVFMITGGMIMHLTDALMANKKMKYICFQHEQAAAMAADAYGRYTGRLGVAYVTAGPGVLNTITGVVGAYVDSAPCIIVGGQSKVSLAKVEGPRQFPLQGYNAIPMFKHITKYAVILDDLSKVRYEVEKCIHIAKSPRVGPVYLECPVDVQGAWFDPDLCKGYVPPVQDIIIYSNKFKRQTEQVKQELLKSKRPLVLAGAGVRLSGCIAELQKFIEKTNIPIVTSRLGMDLIGDDHSLFIGRPGTYGDRAANFAVQNCDLLIVLGCRMGIGLVGYDFQNFAMHARKVMVDVDEQELKKPAVVPDIPIKADVGEFLKVLKGNLKGYRNHNTDWVKKAQYWKDKYPVDLPEYSKEKNGINSYHFTRVLSEKMSKDSLFVVDTGSCFHVYAQAFKVKYGQRHIITGGLSTMGYMPAVIGVAAIDRRKDVYCVTGDGSVQMNLQELQTIAFNKLPVKIIIFNNNGYLLIRHTQMNFCGGRLIGESPASGVGFPNMKKIALAYGIKYMKISKRSEMEKKIKELQKAKGPIICEVMTPPNQLLIPRIASKKLDDGRMVSMPFDDMFPFMSREEYLGNCLREKVECKNG